ncbi:MAG: DUF3750 domain-containing protein [Verrucomicrobiota bacterium JB023]|nr:DUF3750 domain-containing protein [Verrucomicrobiota bacterium JB023]
MLRHSLLALIAFLSVSCQTAVIHENATVVVKDVQIPSSMPWYSRFAKHTFIDYRDAPGQPWHRLEIVNKNSGIDHGPISAAQAHSPRRWGERVRILKQVREETPNTSQDIRAFAARYDASVYRAWPGPNSNTFAEELLRSSKGIAAVIDHNAIGKEHDFYFGPTAGGTGLEIQTPLLGTALGLREGVELNLIGLTFRVSFWPPSLQLPFLPAVLPGAPRLAPPPHQPAPSPQSAE